MKPWEETWRTNALDGRHVECPAPGLRDDDAFRVAEVYMGSEDGTQARFDRARFIAAAPDMAKALLHVARASVNERLLDDDGKVIDMQAIVRAALAKAGVPL
jgi:hypothetical protein